jgi:hypothetical protein
MCKKGLGILIPIQEGQKMARRKNEKQCFNKNSSPKELDVLSSGLGGVFFVWKEINTF